MVSGDRRASEIVLEAAVAYAARGWAPTPVHHRSKRPVLSSWQDLRLGPRELKAHFDRPDVNVGIVLGSASGGLVDIDLDDLVAERIAPRLLPRTEAVFGRPSKPRSHYIYEVKAPQRTSRLSAASGTIVEIRSNGGQTVFPPSTHESGEPIRWVDRDIPASVEWEALELAIRRVAAATLLAKNWAEGRRHDLALCVGGAFAHAGWDLGSAEKFFAVVIEAASDPEINDRMQTLRSSFARESSGAEVTGLPTLIRLIGEDQALLFAKWLDLGGTQQTLTPPDARTSSFELTDLGNAERFAEQHASEVLYCPDRGEWLVWNGRYWDRDLGYIQILAGETARSIRDSIPSNAPPSLTKVHASWAHVSQAASRLNAMTELARALPTVQVRAHELDRHLTLLNLENGTLDLQSGFLQPHDRHDFCTRMAPVEYDAEAVDEIWELFIQQTLQGDPDVIAFVQRATGYCLCGSAEEEVFFLVHGPGGSGKSTYVESIRAVLGDYGQSANPETFLARHGESVRNDIARMHGTRLVIATEMAEGRRLDAALIRQITGGDRVTARFLYKEYFEFVPQFKLWLVANDMPQLSAFDSGIWRRLVCIPFTQALSPEARDPGVKRHLLSDAGARSAILAWLLRGYQDWKRNGLQPPKRVLEATAAYRQGQDPLRDFFEERCRLEPRSQIEVCKLYEAYRAFAASEHLESVLPKGSFCKLIAQRDGVQLDRAYVGLGGTRKQRRVIRGVAFQEDCDDLPI
jgi:putative DNA primase/helicase